MPSYLRYCTLLFAACNLLSTNPSYALFPQKEKTESQEKTYLVCYYRDKVTGQMSWEWGKDEAKQSVELEGQWTDNSAGSMLKINAQDKDIEPYLTNICINTNQNETREFAEYGIANNRTSFRHQIWFEQPSNTTLPFSRIVAFGDSLTDNGNLFNYTHESIVTGSYYLGRFSNGPVWVEYVNKHYGLHLYDWAVSGVTSDSELPVPYNMDTQVDDYIKTMGEVQNPAYDKSLYVLFIGGNNYIFHIDANPDDIVYNVIMSMKKLIAQGGRYFIVPTVPDVSKTPFVSDMSDATKADDAARIKRHNQLLLDSLENLKQEYPPGFITILSPDTQAFLSDVVANPSKYGVTNVTEKCDKGLPLGSYNPSTFCDDPKTYLFWDFVHPTTKIHCEMAQDIMTSMTDVFHLPPFSQDYAQCDVSFVNKK
jgi:thermolabile hemolysin